MIPAALYRLSEARWLRQVLDMARTFRWRVAHFRPALDRRGRWRTAVDGDGAGFPDLVLVHEQTGDLIFAELKSERGKLEPNQETWGRLINAGAPGRFEVWRPRDFDRVRARLMAHHRGPRRGDDAPPADPNPAVAFAPNVRRE